MSSQSSIKILSEKFGLCLPFTQTKRDFFLLNIEFDQLKAEE